MNGARIALVHPWRAGRAVVRSRGARRPGGWRRSLVLAGIFALVLAAAWHWGRDLSLWSVDDVRVTGATGQDGVRVDAALRNAARGMTTLHVRADELRAAVARFPIVKSLRIHPGFPHALRIEVVENVAVAALASTGQPVAVAADGTVLRDRPADGLPLIPAAGVLVRARVTDRRVADAIALAGAAPAGARGLIARISSGGSDGLRADLQGGLRLIFGSGADLHAKWAAALRVMADTRAQGAAYLDLRIPGRPLVGGSAPTSQPPATSGSPTGTPGATAAGAPTDTPAGTPTGTPGAGDPSASGGDRQAQNPVTTGGEPPA